MDGDGKLREMQHIQRLSEGDSRKIASLLDTDFEIRANEFVQRTKHNPDETTNLLLTYLAKLKE